MSRCEILNTRWGEMMDLINCLAIFNGVAKEKKKKRKLTYDEAIRLR